MTTLHHATQSSASAFTSSDSGPYTALAAARDAEGNHVAAVNLLVKGVEQGDLDAQTELGKRLVVGDRAPNQPRDGVGLIVRAAEAGGAEALSILSVFFALGMYVREDWHQALTALHMSAARGWAPAQAQLRALTADKELNDDSDAVDYWARLAASVSLQDWSTAPAAVRLSDDPVIRTYPGFANKAVCDWLVAKARDRLTRAQVYDSVQRTVTESHTRTNSAAIFNMVDTDLVNLLLQRRMVACTGEKFRHFEAATVLHYAPGEEISEHYDFINPRSPDYEDIIREQGQRIITFIIYLNEEFEGGETEFPDLGISHKGHQGEGIFFVNALEDGSPDLRTLHAGRPPRQGEKWIVTQFIRNRPAL